MTLDGDGQNDPSNILDLINHYNNNTPFFSDRNRRKEMIPLLEELLLGLLLLEEYF